MFLKPVKPGCRRNCFNNRWRSFLFRFLIVVFVCLICLIFFICAPAPPAKRFLVHNDTFLCIFFLFVRASGEAILGTQRYCSNKNEENNINWADNRLMKIVSIQTQYVLEDLYSFLICFQSFCFSRDPGERCLITIGCIFLK